MADEAYKAGYDKIDWSNHKPWTPKKREAPKRGGLACPMFISDTMEPTEHVDGKHYDSKSAFRAVTKAQGYEEVGNDESRFRRDKPKRDTTKVDNAIRKAIAENT